MFALIALLALQPLTAAAQQASQPASKGFSFAVYGDSRSMMYLPYKQDQEAEARQLMVHMYKEEAQRNNNSSAMRSHV